MSSSDVTDITEAVGSSIPPSPGVLPRPLDHRSRLAPGYYRGRWIIGPAEPRGITEAVGSSVPPSPGVLVSLTY